MKKKKSDTPKGEKKTTTQVQTPRCRANAALAIKKKSQETKARWLKEYLNIEKNLGVLGNVHSAVGIKKATFYDWLKDDPEFKKAYEEARSRRLDYFEYIVLDEAYKVRNTKLLEMMTRTLLKERGYDPTQKVDISATVNLIGLDDIRKKNNDEQ